VPLDQWTPDELQQTLEALNQVKERTELVDGAFADGLASLGASEHPQIGDWQLELPARGELTLPSRLGEGRSGTGKPGLQGKPDLDRPELPQIQKPDLPSRGRR